jgi:hypothetical protein
MGPLTLAAVYLLPNQTIHQEQLENFYHSLGYRFIAGGDYNAKHTNWGSRIISSRGRVLLKTMENNNLKPLSSRKPTYWPTDREKLPDLIDFCVTKGIPPNFAVAKSCLELSSFPAPLHTCNPIHPTRTSTQDLQQEDRLGRLSPPPQWETPIEHPS